MSITGNTEAPSDDALSLILNFQIPIANEWDAWHLGGVRVLRQCSLEVVPTHARPAQPAGLTGVDTRRLEMKSGLGSRSADTTMVVFQACSVPRIC